MPPPAVGRDADVTVDEVRPQGPRTALAAR